MHYKRMPIEIEAPEALGYDSIDCNLAESSFTDTVLRDVDLDLGSLVLCYGDHMGLPALRDILAREHAGIGPEQVLVTAGAAAALFIVASSLLGAGDEIVVVRPNYATNLETPRAIGAHLKTIDLKYVNNFQIDIDEVARAIGGATRCVSITHPHNPTGAAVPLDTLVALVELCERNHCFLLVDETYRDLAYGEQTPLAATLSDRVISVSSMSKTYGLPGIRIGWLVTRNSELMQTFLAAKEQIFICGSVVDEEIGYRYLQARNRYFPAIRDSIEAKFAITRQWMENSRYLEWVQPQGGVVGFPRMVHPEQHDVERFYRVLFEKYATYVGPGHWFEMPRHYFRLGFGWPGIEELQQGLANIEAALDDSLRK